MFVFPQLIKTSKALKTCWNQSISHNSCNNYDLYYIIIYCSAKQVCRMLWFNPFWLKLKQQHKRCKEETLGSGSTGKVYGNKMAFETAKHCNEFPDILFTVWKSVCWIVASLFGRCGNPACRKASCKLASSVCVYVQCHKTLLEKNTLTYAVYLKEHSTAGEF